MHSNWFPRKSLQLTIWQNLWRQEKIKKLVHKIPMRLDITKKWKFEVEIMDTEAHTQVIWSRSRRRWSNSLTKFRVSRIKTYWHADITPTPWYQPTAATSAMTIFTPDLNTVYEWWDLLPICIVQNKPSTQFSAVAKQPHSILISKSEANLPSISRRSQWPQQTSYHNHSPPKNRYHNRSPPKNCKFTPKSERSITALIWPVPTPQHNGRRTKPWQSHLSCSPLQNSKATDGSTRTFEPSDYAPDDSISDIMQSESFNKSLTWQGIITTM